MIQGGYFLERDDRHQTANCRWLGHCLGMQSLFKSLGMRHSEVITLVWVRKSSTLLRAEEIVLVAVWIEEAKVRIALRVIVQSPDIDHHSSFSW